MKFPSPIFRKTLSRVVLMLLLATVVDAASSNEPPSTGAKIELLSRALQARDSGDVAGARQYLRELLVLAPNDTTVKGLLDNLERAQPRKVTSTGGPLPSSRAAAPKDEAERLAREEEARQARLLAAARTALQEARTLADSGQVDGALEKIAAVRTSLPENNLTQDLIAALDAMRNEILARRERPPSVSPLNQGAPSPATSNKDVAGMLQRGRSQYFAEETALAAGTFRRAQKFEPTNTEAGPSTDTRNRTSEQMLGEVTRAWQRPAVYPEATAEPGPEARVSPIEEKLRSIMLPEVNFSGMELSRVINTLGVLTAEFDPAGSAPKGVNIVLIDQSGASPQVSITLRNLPLKRVLDLITDSVGYQYEVQADAVVVRPGGTAAVLETHFFAVSRSTVLRLTGRGGPAPGAVASGGDRLAGAAGGAPVPAAEGEGLAIRNFLQLAGVGFDAVPGSTLAFDGSQLIITQTPRNLERIRNILGRYHDVRQVEIEAKFMEVQEGALEELGLQWNVAQKPAPSGAARSTYTTADGVNRTLADAFRNTSNSQQITISGPGVPSGELNLGTAAPVIPGGTLLGTNARPLADIHGIIGGFDVNALVRALSQKSGSELLSAPKLTVLSGNPATITVAQELRYPQSYGQIQSQVGTGNISGGGAAGVSITSGTPQEFTTRNVGVELRVTPTVEEDARSISLDLHPKVTEFEGFVEYGGPSIAISGGTTVTVPPGFYQPIFSVREVTTKVTLWDGATLVMGGLTREDVKKIKDKVPVLGNLPMVGRLFRTHGESSQKRNLLIFVTASLVNPGGSLKIQPAGTVTEAKNPPPVRDLHAK